MSDGYCEKHYIYLCEECKDRGRDAYSGSFYRLPPEKSQKAKLEVITIINGCIRTGLLEYVNGQLVITELGNKTENWKAFVDAQNPVHP